MQNPSKLLKNFVFSVVAFSTFALSLSSVPALGVENPGNPGGPGGPNVPISNTNSNVTVTPASAATSSSTPTFGINLTSCLSTFNWQQYLNDSKNGISSNPYINKDCVRQDNLANNGTRTVTKNGQGKVTAVNYTIGSTTLNKTKYADFTVGQSSTKTAFGNLPVLGIFPNGSYTAQGLNTYEINGSLQTNAGSVDRSQKTGLTSIFNATQLNQIYSTGGDKNGLPRSPNTGPERFNVVNGQPTWLGGYCKVENGQLKIRTQWAGPDQNGNQLSYNINVASYGLDPNSPITTCSWPNDPAYVSAKLYDPEGVVKDNNLEAYQFVYEIPYPKTQTECDTLFPNAFQTYTECLTWFQTRYSLPLTGSSTGTGIFYTYTYFGAFDDKYTQWVGWVNPDINKARKTFSSNATLAELRTYFQDPIDCLQSVYGSGQSRNVLIGQVDGSSQASKDAYRTCLKSKFDSFIKGADGYSVYAY